MTIFETSVQPGESAQHHPQEGPGAPLRALLLGLGVAAMALGAQRWGLIPGPVLLVGTGMAALALPTSRELSRRMLYVGCAFLGLVPLLWRHPIASIAPIARLGFVFAICVGFLVGWLYLQPDRSVALRRLLPRIRLVDGALAAGILLTVWMMWPLFRVRSSVEALGILLQGWDFAAHFNMTEMLRVHGVPISQVGASAMGPWQYADYPAGFHAVVASVMELTVGTTPATHSLELTAFAHATALVCLVAIGTVIAGLVALPVARRNTGVTYVLTLLTALSLTVGPGSGNLLVHGFPNFIVATALLACVPLLVIPLARLTSFAPVLALAAVLVGMAANWALLLLPAVAGCLVAVLPLRRARWPGSFAGWLRLMSVAGLVAVGLAVAWGDLGSGSGEVGLSRLLLTEGGFVAGSKAEVFAPVIAAAAASGTALVASRRSGAHSAMLLRAGFLALIPAVGSGLGLVIAAYQMDRSGHLSYYFWKFMTAVQLSSVVLLAATVMTLAVSLGGWRVSPWERSAAIATVGVSFAVFTGALHIATNLLAVRVPPGLVSRGLMESARQNPGDVTPVVLRAAETVTGEVPHFFIPSRMDGTTPRLLNQWVFALSGQWSTSSYAVVNRIWGDDTPPELRPDDVTSALARVFDLSPVGCVIVEPEVWSDVLDAPVTISREDRVMTW